MQRIEITDREAGRRLDTYLQKALPGAGLSFLCRMLRKKNITLNGRKADGTVRLSAGDTIEMFFSDETFDKLKSPDRSASLPDRPADDKDIYIRAYKQLRGIKVVYEDDDFIFIDKPAGILSQTSEHGSISVNEWLVGREITEHNLDPSSLNTFKPAFANRLDRNTSGIMPGGKTLKALQTLNEAIRSGNVTKIYRCIATGHPDDAFPVRNESFLEVTGYLTKDREKNLVRIYRDPEEIRSGISEAKKIRTGFRLVEQLEEEMLLEVDLHTGKSHQIRAQLSALGHPIVGDPKYGSLPESGQGYEDNKKGRSQHAQLLHAYSLTFPEIKDYPEISGRTFKTEPENF